METALVQQFFDFFEDFINLCHSEQWPSNETKPDEIRNAFAMSLHIEKCLEKFRQQSIIDEFLTTFNSSQKSTALFLKNCLNDPSKYVLKKIITSSTNVQMMDMAFKVFLNMFPEEKLETYLLELMVEAASKETLLNNLYKEVPKDQLIVFKSIFLLSEINNSEECKNSLIDLINRNTKEIMELLVVCLCNDDIKYLSAVTILVNAFLTVMLVKNCTNKTFWKLFFETDEHYLIKLCLKYSDMFKVIVKALIDCGRLLKENMSAQYFYINLTYSELLRILSKIVTNENLKLELMDIIHENNEDLKFWEKIIS
ncbi:uncharacterized protein LOC126978177 isoform X1 [Leptidea sinapis]|uniref:uncharacterized protein LOC126978177 isoform X1 n=1 Tax=Leptidea sinapis TaxID=189913 RepID=UPI002129EEC1|nr:uncharacterized protein LOC126978177 isoform X1 [Leptidea sinapis]